jgi:hypothetical protein
MIKRTCLFIDDDKQDDVFPIIKSEGLKYQLDIECYQFNVGNQERRDLLENEEISLEKVIKVFKEEFRSVKIDLIAFDWNIGSGIKGPTLIKHFNDNDIRKNVAKILYSGALEEEVQKLCEDYRKNTGMPFKEIWGQIKTLISTNALDFAGKENYEKRVVQLLRTIDDTFESSIEEELRKFPDFVFKSSFTNKHFNGRTFAEIADIVDGDKNLRNDLTKEITQQVMAYLTERI